MRDGGGLERPEAEVKAELNDLIKTIESGEVVNTPESVKEEIQGFEDVITEYLQNNALELSAEKRNTLTSKILQKALIETIEQYKDKEVKTQAEYETGVQKIEENLRKNLDAIEDGLEVKFSEIKEKILEDTKSTINQMDVFRDIVDINVNDPEAMEKYTEPQQKFIREQIKERDGLAEKSISQAKKKLLEFDIDGDFTLSPEEIQLFKDEVVSQAKILEEGQNVDDNDAEINTKAGEIKSVDTLIPSDLVRNISNAETAAERDKENFTIAEGSMLPEAWCSVGKEIGPIAFASPEDEKTVGMGEMFPVSVREVLVTRPDGTTMYGIRQGLGGGFYTETGKYVAVYDGDSIEVKTTDPEAGETHKKEYQSEYARVTADQESEPLTEQLFTQQTKLDSSEKITIADKEVEEKKAVYQMAMRHGVDPYLFLAIQSQKQTEQRQDFTELYLTARSMKRLMISLESRGEELYTKDAFGTKMPNPAFMAMLASQGITGMPRMKADELMNSFQNISGLTYTAEQKQILEKAKIQYESVSDPTDYSLEYDPKEGFPRFERRVRSKDFYNHRKFLDNFEYKYENMPPAKAELIRSIVDLVEEGKLPLKYAPRELPRLPLIDMHMLQLLVFLGKNRHEFPHLSISSMLRSNEHNMDLGSKAASKSKHKCGCGADITVHHPSDSFEERKAIYDKLERMYKAEFKEKDRKFSFLVHSTREDYSPPPHYGHDNIHFHAQYMTDNYFEYATDKDIDRTLTKFVQAKEKTPVQQQSAELADAHNHNHEHTQNYEKLSKFGKSREDEYFTQNEDPEKDPYNLFYRDIYEGLDFRKNLENIKEACESSDSGYAVMFVESENMTYIYKDGEYVNEIIGGGGTKSSKNFDKRKQGDRTTPLGVYTLTPERHGKYKDAWRLDYPKPEHKARAKAEGIRDPGDGILYHRLGISDQNAKKMAEGKDYSEGCVNFAKKDWDLVTRYLGKSGSPKSKMIIIPELPKGSDPRNPMKTKKQNQNQNEQLS